MDRTTVEIFHAKMDAMLKDLLAEFNSEISKSHITYSDTKLKISIETVERNADGSVNVFDLIVIQFISTDQKINCALKCLKTDIFAEVEEQLYQQYESYRETNNNFITKGNIVLRFKKICENNIQNGDKVQLVKI